MARTLQQMLDEVASEQFEIEAYGTLVRQWFNDAAQDLSREITLPQLQSTTTVTVNGDEFTLPADIQVVSSVIGKRGPLIEVDIATIDRWSPSVGDASAFAVYGNVLVLHPAPVSQELTIRYEGGLPDLTDADASTVLQFPDDYLDLLITYAISKAYAKEDDFEASTFHWNAWIAGVARMRSQIQKRTKGGARQIQGMITDSYRPRFSRP